MTKNRPPRTTVRHGRIAFAAVQDEIKAALDRGEWMSQIYEDRKDRLPFSYPQFTKYVRRTFGDPLPLSASAPLTAPALAPPPTPQAPAASTPKEPLQQVKDDRPKRFKMKPKSDSDLF